MKIDRATETGIDFLRGFLSIMVLIAHAIEAVRLVLPGSFEYPGFALLTPGGFWVGGFFVLSGFCIGLTVMRSLSNGTYNPWSYLFQRFTRLIPIYWIGLLLAVGAWSIGNRGEFPLRWLWINLSWMQNFFNGSFPHFGPSWSITNEVVYYLAFPLLLIAGKGEGKVLLAGFAFYGLVAVAAGLLWLFPLKRQEWFIPFWTIPWNGVSWMFGFGALWLGGRMQANGTLAQRKSLFLWMALALLVIAYTCRTWNVLTNQRAMVSMAMLPLPGTAFALLILGLSSVSDFAKDAARAQAKWFGALSYPLYLFHMPLIGAIIALLWKSDIHPDPLLLLSILIVVPLLLCGTLGVALERYFLEKRKQWIRRTQTRQIAAL